MKEIYLLIIEDRHEDIQIYPYTTYEQADINYNNYIQNNSRVVIEDIFKLTQDSKPDMSYFLNYSAYSAEGDKLYIIKKTLDEDLFYYED